MDPNNQPISTNANVDNGETVNIPIIYEVLIPAEMATLPSTDIGNQDALLLQLGDQADVSQDQPIGISLEGPIGVNLSGLIDIILPPLIIPADILVGGTVNDVIGSTAESRIEGAARDQVHTPLNGPFIDPVIGGIDDQLVQIGGFQIGGPIDVLYGPIRAPLTIPIGSEGGIAANDVLGGIIDSIVHGLAGSAPEDTVSGANSRASSYENGGANTIANGGATCNVHGGINDFAMTGTICNRVCCAIGDSVRSSANSQADLGIRGPVDRRTNAEVGNAVGNQIGEIVSDQIDPPLSIPVSNTYLPSELSITSDPLGAGNGNPVGNNIGFSDNNIYYEPLDEFSDLEYLFNNEAAEHFITNYDGFNDDQYNGEPEDIPNVANPIDVQSNTTQNNTENGNNQTGNNQTGNNQSEGQNNASPQVYLVRNRYYL